MTLFKRLCLMIICVLNLALLLPKSTFACTQSCKSRAKFNYIVCSLNNPRKLVRYNWWHFEYKSDMIEYWKDYW